MTTEATSPADAPVVDQTPEEQDPFALLPEIRVVSNDDPRQGVLFDEVSGPEFAREEPASAGEVPAPGTTVPNEGTPPVTIPAAEQQQLQDLEQGAQGITDPDELQRYYQRGTTRQMQERAELRQKLAQAEQQLAENNERLASLEKLAGDAQSYDQTEAVIRAVAERLPEDEHELMAITSDRHKLASLIGNISASMTQQQLANHPTSDPRVEALQTELGNTATAMRYLIGRDPGNRELLEAAGRVETLYRQRTGKSVTEDTELHQRLGKGPVDILFTAAEQLVAYERQNGSTGAPPTPDASVPAGDAVVGSTPDELRRRAAALRTEESVLVSPADITRASSRDRTPKGAGAIGKVIDQAWDEVMSAGSV
jgi:hypothetical protein